MATRTMSISYSDHVEIFFGDVLFDEYTVLVDFIWIADIFTFSCSKSILILKALLIMLVLMTL